MTINEFTATDGYCWKYRRYPTLGEPLARLVWLHGLRSHGGWYDASSMKFALAGVEVHFLDRRGAGLNLAQRGDTPSFRRLLDDVAEYLRTMPRNVPLILAGLSWGGKLAVALPHRAPGLIDGLLLLAPGLKPRVSPSLLTKFRVLWNAVVNPTKLFPIPLNEPELFTSNPIAQLFIQLDQEGLTQVTARMLARSFGLDVYIRLAKKQVTMPTLLLLAGQDRIIDNQQVLKLCRSFQTNSLTVHEYAEAHHTLEFEGQQHPWRSDVLNWLRELRPPG